jgi:CRISPR-associated protein Csa3
MRTYIAPIGYDSTRVTRPILSQGIERSTKIQLINPTTTSDSGRNEQAINDVRRIIEQIEPDVEMETTEVPHNDFKTAIEVCGSLIDNAHGEVIVIFGGGARDIFLPLTVSALSRVDQIQSSHLFSDINGEVHEISLPDLTANAPKQTKSTLETISTLDTPVSLTTITESVDISKSTASRHVKLLERQNFVKSEMHGKTKVVDLTTTGRLLVNRP